MNNDFKMYILELSKEIIKESGEILTYNRLIDIYKKLMSEMNLHDQERQIANNPHNFITRLKPIKPIF